MDPHAELSDLRYPIGPPAQETGPDVRRRSIEDIRELPAHFSAAFRGLDSTQLETPYRPDGWTLRQLAHHVTDSHINASVRLRLALTEDWPVIKPYEEARWAELADARHSPIETSLDLLTPLHARWVALLQALDEAEWSRGYVHPERGRTTIDAMTQLYSWHGRHHTAHALRLRERMGW